MKHTDPAMDAAAARVHPEQVAETEVFTQNVIDHFNGQLALARRLR